MTITLYKKGVDPCQVAPEALDFHLLQGWVEDPADVEEDTAVIAAPLPFIVGKAEPEQPKGTVCQECASKDLQLAEKDETIKDLEEVVKSQQDTITRMKAASLAPEGVTNPERVQAISIAINQIPKEQWNSPSGGRPAMPLLKDIATITGFAVKADEVAAIIKGE